MARTVLVRAPLPGSKRGLRSLRLRSRTEKSSEVAEVLRMKKLNNAYKLWLEPRMAIDGEVFRRCLVSLTKLKDWSMTATDQDRNIVEYCHRKEGKIRCTLQASMKSLAMETDREEEVDEQQWESLVQQVIGAFSSETKFQTDDLQVLALVRKFRFPRKGNIYAFIRDEFLANSPLHKLTKEMDLFDLNFVMKSLGQNEIRPS